MTKKKTVKKITTQKSFERFVKETLNKTPKAKAKANVIVEVTGCEAGCCVNVLLGLKEKDGQLTAAGLVNALADLMQRVKANPPTAKMRELLNGSNTSSH